jgi:hypothetical protein
MKTSLVKSWALGIAIALAAICLASRAEAQDLSGDWRINLEDSDEPADVFEPVTRRDSGGLGGVRAGVSIFGIPVDVTDVLPDRNSDGEEPQDEIRGELGKLRRHLTDSVDALSIIETPETTRIKYDDLGTFIYSTDQTIDVGDATVDAEWRRGVYYVERFIDERTEVVERFWLDRGDPNRLHWSVSIDLTTGKNVRIERVFDRIVAQ